MIILASTSKTRQTILHNAGLEFSSQSPEVDEHALAASHLHWSPTERAENLAIAKALDVSGRNTDAIVIGADQVLTCDGDVFNKPQDLADCRQQLLSLRTRTHHLISALACAKGNGLQWQTTDVATLQMRDFSEAFLDKYLADQAQYVCKSVGGYQIESRGIQLFERIQGDHFTILGLPLLPLLHYLRAAGIIAR